jgi:hypothetical protein
VQEESAVAVGEALSAIQRGPAGYSAGAAAGVVVVAVDSAGTGKGAWAARWVWCRLVFVLVRVYYIIEFLLLKIINA